MLGVGYWRPGVQKLEYTGSRQGPQTHFPGILVLPNIPCNVDQAKTGKKLVQEKETYCSLKPSLSCSEYQNLLT